MGQPIAQRVVLATAADPLVLSSGARLGPVEVAYETYGVLAPGRDKAVFVCHALTGDAHAAGDGGWWETVIGPGRPLDTDRYFVICPNLLGGCRAPRARSRQTRPPGRQRLDFPILGVTDLVTVHRRLLRHLGVERLHAAGGGSLGWMQVLQWALHPLRHRLALPHPPLGADPRPPGRGRRTRRAPRGPLALGPRLVPAQPARLPLARPRLPLLSTHPVNHH